MRSGQPIENENEDKNSFLIPPHYIFEFIKASSIDDLCKMAEENTLLLKILLLLKPYSDKYQSKILKEYEAAPVITPPGTLDPLFVTAHSYR